MKKTMTEKIIEFVQYKNEIGVELKAERINLISFGKFMDSHYPGKPLTVADLQLVNNGNVRLFGKGRKQRVIPLWKSTIAILKRWVESNCFQKNSPLFPSNRNVKMTRSAVAKRLELAVSLAKKECKSLRGRNISPHTLRHTTAMHLLQSGVDITVISLWLGHESIETTHIYVTSDMKQKEQALRSLQEPQQKTSRFKADDSLIKFLEGLK